MIGSPPVPAIESVIAHLKRTSPHELDEFLAPDVMLVPCPRSAPFPPKQSPALWVPHRICERLQMEGYGSWILPILTRVVAVKKSAFAAPGERPTPKRHMETMEVFHSLDAPERITLVDDVVTKGATLLGGASLLASAFPGADIRAFALVRTTGLVPEVTRLVDPVVGTISLDAWGEAERNP